MDEESDTFETVPGKFNFDFNIVSKKTNIFFLNS